MRYKTAIVDGSNIFFKSFSVKKDLSVPIDGKEIFTGGTFGFIQSLIALKRDYLEDDAAILVAWDRGYKRRLKIYPEYKANRDKSEWEDYQNFKTQRMYLCKVLRVMGIRQAFKNGEEADDIVGTLSKSRSKNGDSVLIMSADKDFKQLITDGVDLLAHKGKDDIKVWNKESWTKENGFSPEHFVYVLALMGDTGDNIPGVDGIGEVGANKLIVNNLDLLEAIRLGKDYSPYIPEKQNSNIKKLLEQIDRFILSYDLALIDRNITGMRITSNVKDMRRLEQIFERLEFNTLLKKANWDIIKEL